MYKTFTLPLKSLPLKWGAFALSALFILTACGGFTIDINSFGQDSECSANPFLTECDSQRNISAIRTLIIDDCASNPEKANTRLCLAADAATNTPDTTESCEDNPFADGCGGTGEVADVRDIEGLDDPFDTTPKDELAKSEFNKGDGKITIASLEIVDLCSDPTTADNERCTPAVIACITNPFSGSCQGDNVLGNFVRGTVTVSKTVILQDKRAEDCRTGSIDRALCQNLNVQKQRCTGAAFGDAICSAVTHSVCKADAFDPLCGEKENFAGVYFNERSDICYEQPNNPNCPGTNGHIAVVCNEYPFDRLCDGNADYENVRANACDANPNVSPNCPVVVPTPTPTTNRVTAKVWVDSFNGNLRKTPSANYSETGNEAEFLEGNADDLNSGVLGDSRYYRHTRFGVKMFSLNLDTASFDGKYLNGDASDGVAFFDGVPYQGSGIFKYAGILSTTDLGAPLNQTGRATWYGSINETDWYIQNQDFSLDIEFNGAAGGTIKGSVQSPSYSYRHELHYLLLTGTFDSNGVISGISNKGFFTDGNTDLPIAGRDVGRRVIGVLTGLIGEEGAVGAFVAKDAGYIGYAGGFVVRPSAAFALPEPLVNDARVTTADWLNSFNEDLAVAPTLVKGVGGILPRKNEFVKASKTGLALQTYKRSSYRVVTFANAIFDGNALGGDAADGFAIVDASSQHAGILSGTDLGAPLTQTQGSASWEGRIVVLGRWAGYVDSDFVLHINFGVGNQFGTVTGQVRAEGAGTADYKYRLDGEFDESGVIKGTAEYGNFNNEDTKIPRYWRKPGTLTGLIGEEGAIGVFLSTEEVGYGGYVGGFIASPSTDFVSPVPATPQVTAAVWADSFDEPLSHVPTANSTKSKFLIGRATDLNDGGLSPYSRDSDYNDGLNLADASFNRVALGGDRADGVGFFAAGRNGTSGVYSYAGILSGTNLGAPLTQTIGSAKWGGSFRVEGGDPKDFVLNISFGTGDGAGEIEAIFERYSATSSYHLQGEFDDSGVIAGTATGTAWGDAGRANIASGGTDQSVGKLTGLIGEEGAVGAFLIGSWFGGFVARPSAGNLQSLTQNCVDNPFHSYCDSGYNDARASACIADPDQLRCRYTVERVCNGNPFDRLCRNTTIYLNARKTQCRSTWNDPRCGATIRAVCGVDPFDRMCNSVYDTPRETACRNGGANTQCGGIVAGICSGNPFDPLCGSGYTQNRRNACSSDPFATRCAGAGYNDLRVTFCLANVGTHPSCPAPEPTITEPTTPQVTAEVWADSFDTPLATAARDDDVWSEFLIGRATDLDDGGVRGYYDGWRDFDYGNFNLADATFNGIALGGDAEDGMAFFASNSINSYAGILSGTNLGAPLTQTQGTAKWIGSFKVEAWTGVTDFVLNVSFGTGEGAGEIEALVQLHWYSRNYHIKGEFDDAGVITGTAPRGTFRTHDPDNRGLVYGSGRLTGLIGEEGAVGAIIVGDYYAGFVARPSSAEELRNVEETCNDDPFHKWCNLGYEAERNAVVEHCIIDDNALNVERCGSVNKFHLCIKHPFLDNCNLRLSSYYEQTRANRLAFCRTAGNADNALCTIEDTFVYICKKHPFDVQCLGSDRFMPWRRTACTDDPFAPRCAGDGYNDLRVTFCARNASNPACPVLEPTITEVATPQVTAKVWADSFASPLSHAASAADIWSKLLVGRATDLNNGGIRTSRRGNLNFADATFNGVALGEDAEDGMAFFASYPLNSYAGILSGTNLGAPLTDTAGSAKWVGSFLLEVWSPTDFVLNVSFGTGDGAGEIEGLVQLHPYYLDVHVKGEFDDAGVITGTVARGIYRTNDPNNRGVVFRHRGRLTGLIGEEGAVGAFVVGNYYGGFVARPSSAAELQNVEETCADDPFHKWCNLGYETERDAILDHCIIGGNANDERCDSANELDDCINDPFQSDCDDRLPQYYQQARDNRVAFCRTAGNANNALCTVEDTFAYICTNHPFSTQCFGNDDYMSLRRNACSGDPFATRCAGDGYNDLRVSFCEDNVGNPACPTPQVTASVWADSFDEPLSHAASLDDTEDKFLIGRETDLDTGDVGVSRYSPLMSLNLADATFNGTALGGDRADGVAFFAAGRANDGGRYDYAGVLSGTNLGAPLTNTTRFAKWIGSFNHIYDPQTNTDFVLNISFGTAIDGSPEIEALIQRPGVWESDYYLKGTFDAAGVITGRVRRGYFRTNNPNNRGQAHNSRSRVTGLIGEQGAVGVFINDIEYDGYSGSFGGFVARPPSAEELRTVEQTCVDDPFNQRCTVGYDAERIAHFERCITGGNANDASCDSAKKLYLCINDPFRFNCRHWPQYTEQVRAKRVAFCRIAGSGDNELCTIESTYRHVCRNYPFTAQCLGDYNYSPLRREACSVDPFATRCAAEGYNDLRVTFCDRAVNANNPSCPRPVVPTPTPTTTPTSTPTTNRVTAADWVASFETAPLTVPTSYGSQFLQGNETKLNPGPLFPDVRWMTSRTFADRGYGLINDGTGGYAYFRGYAGPSRGYTAHYYAGILSNTDLGAPLTQTSGSVYWKGDASYGHSNGSGADRSMILKVTFGNGGQGNAGRVNSTINADLMESRFDLEGVFNHQGVISGTATLIRNETTAWRNKKAGTQISGVLSGLIGQKGAVGAFHGKRKASDTAVGTFGGGFVAVANFVNASPVTPDWVTTEDWLASFSPGLAATPNYLNKNYFLRGTRTGLNTGEYKESGLSPRVYSLTLADVTLNGSASDGVAFFKGGLDIIEIELSEYAYAGILSDTDLGAPLTPSSGTAHWQGKFISAFNNKNTVDFIRRNFTLEIDFDNAGSGNAGKITAVIDATTDTTTDTEFEIDGVFNSQGVISGVVSTIRTLPFPEESLSDNRYRNRGLLTGLIGEQGAIGAFVSLPHIRSGFAGGFVAVPNFVDVTPARDRVTWVPSAGRTINRHAEVLTGTDLGAPLAQTTGSVSWNGAFRSGDAYYQQRDFVLRITFGGQEHAGTLSGYVQKNLLGEHYLVEGYFDENGVIGGTVAEWIRTTYTIDNPILTNDSQKDIKLTGLIGSRGAIATFNRGGFVASPDIGLSPEVTERDWLESFNGKVLTIDGTRNDPGLGAFIQGARRGTLTFTPTTLDFVMIDGVPNTNPGDVGVIFRIDMVDGQMRHYAGVLRGTRLGDPLTVLPADTNGNPATATWNGHLGMIANSGAIHRRDIDLSVDFTNQTISHSSVLNTGLKSISLDGTWADNGVIDGTITYDPNPVPNAVNARDGVVRGLIGQYGAVGAFISNDDVTDMPFAGGFVATPPSE